MDVSNVISQILKSSELFPLRWEERTKSVLFNRAFFFYQ
jgi:hypothetical protein